MALGGRVNHDWADDWERRRRRPAKLSNSHGKNGRPTVEESRSFQLGSGTKCRRRLLGIVCIYILSGACRGVESKRTRRPNQKKWARPTRSFWTASKMFFFSKTISNFNSLSDRGLSYVFFFVFSFVAPSSGTPKNFCFWPNRIEVDGRSLGEK